MGSIRWRVGSGEDRRVCAGARCWVAECQPPWFRCSSAGNWFTGDLVTVSSMTGSGSSCQPRSCAGELGAQPTQDWGVCGAVAAGGFGDGGLCG